jgi:hypothetical protein
MEEKEMDLTISQELEEQNSKNPVLSKVHVCINAYIAYMEQVEMDIHESQRLIDQLDGQDRFYYRQELLHVKTMLQTRLNEVKRGIGDLLVLYALETICESKRGHLIGQVYAALLKLLMAYRKESLEWGQSPAQTTSPEGGELRASPIKAFDVEVNWQKSSNHERKVRGEAIHTSLERIEREILTSEEKVSALNEVRMFLEHLVNNSCRIEFGGKAYIIDTFRDVPLLVAHMELFLNGGTMSVEPRAGGRDCA